MFSGNLFFVLYFIIQSEVMSLFLELEIFFQCYKNVSPPSCLSKSDHFSLSTKKTLTTPYPVWSLATALHGPIQEMVSLPNPTTACQLWTVLWGAGRSPARASEHFFLIRTLSYSSFKIVAVSHRVKNYWLRKNLYPTKVSDGFYFTLQDSAARLFLLLLALLFIKELFALFLFIYLGKLKDVYLF